MRILPLICTGFLFSCSSVISGSKQSVTVITPGVEAAACSLTDAKGRVWYVEHTPGSALVKKGDGPISVICKKEGYKVGTNLLQEDLVPSVYGNLLFPPGFIVDSMTGSGEKYTSSIEVQMESIFAKGPKEPWE